MNGGGGYQRGSPVCKQKSGCACGHIHFHDIDILLFFRIFQITDRCWQDISLLP